MYAWLSTLEGRAYSSKKILKLKTLNSIYMKSTYISTWMQRMAALVFVLVGSISTSLADTKLYLENFSFSSAGETKKVAVCLDTDESTIYSVAMTLTMPTGMQLVADGINIKTELVSSRTGALTMESAISNGKIMFSDLLRTSAIEAGNGPIFYVFVKDAGFFASPNASANINISGVELKRQDKSKVDGVVVTGATVTKNGSEVGGISVAFAASEVTMDPGETKTIAVNMDNTGKTVQGFQATLDLPTGWTAEVTGPRGAVTYNASTGRITNITGISGVSGAVLNIALTAPTTFAGSAQIKLSGVKATVDYATVNLSDITTTINATQTVADKPTVEFAAEEIVVYPGKTGKFEVNMANNGITVAGFQADLVLPTGWTAAVTGKRGTYTYNANNGRIMNYTGVTGEEGALFEVALTAPANFEGEAVVKLTNVKTTINYIGVKLDDISMKVLDKDAAKETALADLKAEITAATTLLGEADKTVEPGLSLNNAIAAAQTAVQTAEADMMVADAAVLAAATETLKGAEEAYTAAVEAAAALAAAKQALTDEIAAATALLGEADKTAEPGLSLNNAIATAQAILDNAESTTEQINAAVETLKTAEETYTAAVEAAAKAAAKMALTDEVVAATTLLGDADKTVEPGKALNEAIAAAKAVLAGEATTEELNAAIETLKAAEATYAQAVAEAAAKAAAEAKVVDLKAAAEALAVSAEAKAYEAENVQAKVADAEQAIADVNTAIAAVEAVIAEGKLATDNAEALATAIATAEAKIAAAQTAIQLAEEAYVMQKAADEAAAAEAAAKEAADAKVVDLKAAAEALVISEEAKAYEAENVQAKVADAEQAIADANTAIAAVEAVIAEGKLSTDNKEALATAIATAEAKIAAAQTAIQLAEEAYVLQKAADEAAALADAKAALQDAITAAKAVSVVGMTAESVQALNDAIAAAEAALAAETATVESLNAAKADLEAAVAGLKVAYFAFDGVAYIIDTESGKLVAAGHDWGTRGIVNEIGLDLTFATDPETKMVTIDSRVANNATNHFLGSNLYMDAAAAKWGLLEQDFGFYITDGTQYLSVGADDNLVLSAEPHLWLIVTPEGVKAQRLEDMAAATEENPVDATWMIKAANFNRNDARNAEGWTVSEDCTNKNLSGGNNVNNCAESWHSTFTISQTIEGVPNGVYQLTAQGFWRQDGENEAVPVFFINDQTTVFPVKEGTENSMSDASNSFTEGLYTIEPMEVTVEDGIITLGVKNETNTTIWCIWDNFRLTYLGPDMTALNNAKAELQAAIETAKAAETEGMTDASVQALNDAIAAAEAALAAQDATVESLTAALNDLNAAVAGLTPKPVPVFADGTYYLYNAAIGQYMGAGSSWGTHAVTNAAGLDYTLAFTEDGKYTIDSQVSNGGNSHFLNGEWNDGAAMGWIFAPVEGAEGVYTISNGESFLTAQGENGEVLLQGDATAAAAQWTLKTKEQRVAELAAATKDAPVDATFLVSAANFSRNDLRNAASWTVSEDCTNKNLSGGNNVNNCAESWHSTFTISQVVENVPNGIYQLTAQGFWRQDGENEAVPVFFINDQTTVFPVKEGTENSMSDASNSFTEGLYTIEPMEVTVEDGIITLGVKNETNTTIWCIWDNFRLAYLGEATVVNPDDDVVAAPEGWTNLVANGNLAGDLNANYFSKESPSTEIKTAAIVAGAGKNHSRGIVVKSADEVGQEGAQDWDTQFWIRFNESLPEGTKLHIEFDYAASKAANAGTQAHAEPGMYQHWAAIGDVSFTTEWQHFSKDITVDAAMAKGDNGNGSGTGMLSVAFNLAVERTAVEYYFDNFGAWAQIPEPVQEWENLIVNSDIEGESMECFYVTEQGVGGPFVAIATAGIGKNGSKAVKVQSADDPDDPTTEETEGTDWDSQFFIRLPYQLPAGTKYKVSFDYKADKAGDFDTQAHANPGQYIHWAFCGSGSFTTEWQTYEAEGTVPSQCDGSSAQKTFQTIAFNLAKNRVATEFVFDNVKFFVPKDIVSSLTKNPDENPVHYPTGIKNVMNEMNAEGIFNLNGQKVMKTQKGLYIKNGKKVVIK